VSDIEYNLTIKELPLNERPRERLLQTGASALSTTELMAIILRTGVGGQSALNVAQRLLVRFDGLPGVARAGSTELMSEHGDGACWSLPRPIGHRCARPPTRHNC
jgi:DNA repair protein RadC